MNWGTLAGLLILLEEEEEEEVLSVFLSVLTGHHEDRVDSVFGVDVSWQGNYEV